MKNKTITRFIALFMCVSMVIVMSYAPVNVDAKAGTKVKITLNKKKATLVKGKILQLKLTAKKGKKVKKVKNVKWKTSNKKVATVSKKGKVKTVKKGKATITAKAGKKKYKCKITVNKKKTQTTKYKPLKVESLGMNHSAYLTDKLYDGKNIIISQTSLGIVLGMIANASNDVTKSGCEKYFGMTTDKFNENALALMNRAKSDKMLTMANGVWYKNGYTLSQSFNDALVKYYNVDAKSSPLDNSTVNEINKWASDNTNGMIKKILSEMPNQVVTILTNALMFDGEWKKPFDAEDTCTGKFTKIDGSTVKVKMMNAKEDYYFENKYATGFEKQYGKKGQYSFVAVLPKKTGEFKLSDLDLEGLMKTRTDKYVVDISMPKFSYSYDKSLKDVLNTTEVSPMFNISANPLSKMFTNTPGESIYISDVLQSCKIIVDEEGTKAAAVTTGIANTTSALITNKKTVTLDRSFAYMIVDNQTNQVMFTGKLTEPKKE